MSKDDEKRGGDTVISHHQSGGITAHTVKVGSQDRNFGNEHKDQLLKELLGETRKIVISEFLGTPEALRLGLQIYHFLEDEGYKVEGPNTLYGGLAPKGVRIHKGHPEKIDIAIGSPD